MRNVSIKNKSKRIFVVNLQRGANYGGDPRCRGSRFRMDVPVKLPSGETGVERIQRTLPASLTWLPGETKANLPAAVLDVPAVKRAIPKTLVVVN